MNDEPLKALIRFRMEQADEALRAARLLSESALLREVVNRAYYAMFYAVQALLAEKGKETSKHTGALALFDMDFVKTGVFAKEFSEWLRRAFNLRLKADYAPMFHPTKEQADEVLGKAVQFIAAVKDGLSNWLVADAS